MKAVIEYKRNFREPKVKAKPKQFITFNPMQYVNLRAQKENCDLFQSEDQSKFTILTSEQYHQITAKLKAKGSAALLPI